MNSEDVLFWRAERKLTQQQLADLLGVTVLTIKRWEATHRQPPWYLKLALERLDQLLGITPEPQSQNGPTSTPLETHA